MTVEERLEGTATVRLHHGKRRERYAICRRHLQPIHRVRQHRDGLFGGFTETYGVKRLVWYEMADTMDAAIAAEKRIKRWPREWKRNLIERDNPHWDDLAVPLGLEIMRG